jgi:hypothetical protein
MENFDFVTVLAHVVLVSTLATMVYSVLVYIASRRRSRRPSKRVPAPTPAHVQPARATPASAERGSRLVPMVKVQPLTWRSDTVRL